MVCRFCYEIKHNNPELIEKVVRQHETGFDPMEVLAASVGEKDHNVLLRFKYCPECSMVYFTE